MRMTARENGMNSWLRKTATMIRAKEIVVLFRRARVSSQKAKRLV